MDSANILLLGISLFGAITLLGFFQTKEKGFGKYNTSILILLTILVLCSLLFASNHLDSQTYANVVMAIIGFAGGLVVGKE